MFGVAEGTAWGGGIAIARDNATCYKATLTILQQSEEVQKPDIHQKILGRRVCHKRQQWYQNMNV